MKKYFYAKNDNKYGPFSLEELKNEDITKDTLIWFEGLEDWAPAKDIDEMRPFLELMPPPIKNDIEHDEEFKAGEVNIDEVELHDPLVPQKEKAHIYWIILGFVFCTLGGIIGTAFALNYIFGKYNKKTKLLGWIMFFISFISTAIWKSL